MRLVDRWVGGAVCILLTAYRMLRDAVYKRKSEPVTRILFVKLAEQGSTVLAVAAIRRACEMVGRENVYFLVFEENRFILDVMELIPPQNVVAIRTGTLRDTFSGAMAAIKTLNALKIDAAIDMEFFARSSAALTFLSGAHQRTGFHAGCGDGPYRGNLMTHRLTFNPHLHTADTFESLVGVLTAGPEQLPTLDFTPGDPHPAPTFQTTDRETDEMRLLLREAANGKEVKSLVLLNANCSDLVPLRRWPVDRYVILAQKLLERYDELHVAMTGAPTEANDVDPLVKMVGSDRCFNLAGRTTLRQLLCVYQIAQVLVTNDSGPAHFAALTPIDVVTLFGPETPKLFAARSPRNHVFYEGIVCSPCLSAYNNRTSRCQSNVCMQKIAVDHVFEKVCELYEARR